MPLLLGMKHGVIRLENDRPEEAAVVLDDKEIAALAADFHVPGLVYCGTRDDGLWRSDDAGQTWRRIGARAIPQDAVLSVAVSPIGEHGTPGVVFAGTSPSALFRSYDAGESWTEIESMKHVPSSDTWSFPPQPDTHHVRWIIAHPVFPKRIVVAIEAGALIQTTDGGETWTDRVPGGPYDTHTALVLPDRPHRIVSAAGDGFFESLDSGHTWHKPEEGLPWRYCWSLTADSRDSHLSLTSVAPGPGEGHAGGNRARSAICRRYADQPWIVVTDGLPHHDGMSLSALTADPSRPNTFYALNNRGLFTSPDGGWSWRRMAAPWKDEYVKSRPPAIIAIKD